MLNAYDFRRTTLAAQKLYFPLEDALRLKKRRPAFAAGLNVGTEKNSYDYFLGAIASLAALATRNFTTVLALI
jgi:hypothetical protein